MPTSSSSGDEIQRLRTVEKALAALLQFEANRSATTSKDLEALTAVVSSLNTTVNEDINWDYVSRTITEDIQEQSSEHKINIEQLEESLTLQGKRIHDIGNTVDYLLARFEQQYRNTPDYTSLQLDLQKRYRTIGDLIADYNGGILESRKAIEELRTNIDEMERHRRNSDRDVYEFISLQTLGVNIDGIPLKRFVPISIYVSDEDILTIQRIAISVDLFLDSIGFSTAVEMEPTRGSWFKELFSKSKVALTQEEVMSRLNILQYGIETSKIGINQADNDKKAAEAFEILLRSVENTPTAVIRMGSILLVKDSKSDTGPNVLGQTLNVREMAFLASNPQLLKQPHEIFESLHLSGEQTQDSDHPAPDTLNQHNHLT